MKILMVSPEAAPFAKTGGLGDVLGSLPGALVKLGEEVAVLLPRYRMAAVEEAARVWDVMPLWVGSNSFTAAIDEIVRDGVHYWFVDCPVLYDRPEIYGSYTDNHIRFAALSQTAIAAARGIFRPDIFHVHDWTGGLGGVYLRTTLARDPTFFGSRVVFTIHNLGYQGLFPAAAFADLGLSPAVYNPEGLEFWGQVNFLKAGIVWADAITTVSPAYAREIQTSEYGFGLDGVLRARADRLTGILNGVDYQEWDPRADTHLPVQYTPEDLGGKLVCKESLLRELGLPAGELNTPLIGIVSRFAHQKGFDLLGEIAGWLLTQDLSLAVLGAGETPVEQMFLSLAAAHPEKVAVRIGYDNALAHRIEAGADMFLMPSRYEPCGLNQIYSLRYGTVPIVHATGGLEDTVDEHTGFKFHSFSAPALQAAIADALSAFADGDSWTQRMRRGMALDFSWNASAIAYQRLYQRLTGRMGPAQIRVASSRAVPAS
jgi:starch synthase